MKKLFMLEPNSSNLTDTDNPWKPWYDKCFGMIICAESEEAARQLAHENADDENRGMFLGERIADTNSPWLLKQYSICKELSADTYDAGTVIMKDVASA